MTFEGNYHGSSNSRREGQMALPDMIGSSKKFMDVLENVRIVASADCAVLIQGETGTGKEIIARAIHDASPRRQHRFVPINCAAIPAALLESELFGYERGAFTGATVSKVGRFQAADRGTIFLDEIGELPLELQPKLLRVIQGQEFERLGSAEATRIDVRIMAASNRDLKQMVDEDQFRMDLYYRLNVFPITIPPLRERAGDIPLFVNHFLRLFASRHGKTIEYMADDAMAALVRYHWPGNIRELQNFIERSVILTRGAQLQAPLFELTDKGKPSGHTLADAERAHIGAALRETNWVIGGANGAATRLGLKRTTLIHKMQKLGIRRKAVERRIAYLDSDEQATVPPVDQLAV